MTAAPVRLAVIGLGQMGLAHLDVFSRLAPRAEITAIADGHRPFAERAASRVPSAAVSYDPLDCVHHADIDAAVVATADDTHCDIVAACLARGIHVLCEKPLTTSAAKSAQLVEAEAAHGRRLVQVGYMRRYDDDYRAAYDALRSGRVGEPVLVSQRHRNPLAINDFDAQKLVYSSASHEIDLFRWLTRDEIAEVSAATKSSRDEATVTVVLTLTSRSGILGIVELGRGPGLHYDIGCDIITAGGLLSVSTPTPVFDAAPDSWFQRFDAAYRAQDAAWLAEVANGSITGPSAYDGYAANAVVDAAISALRNGTAQRIEQVLPG